jgi:hypothetical protein
MAGQNLHPRSVSGLFRRNIRAAKKPVNLKTKMKKRLLKLLSGLAACGLATSAYSLTIIPTFDSSITTNANAAAIEAAINFSIGTLQSNLVDNATVKILFVSDESVDLGQSATWASDYIYADYLAALKSRATSINDTNGLSKIPNTAGDPLVNSNNINLKMPLARMTGLDSGYGPDGYDSTISCKMSSMNFTRPPGDLTKYDLIGTLEHEINEVLGFSSNLKRGQPNGPIGVADLFRYTTNLVRTWTTNGDNAYFSVDGTNLLARFNQDPGGDYHDWWSVSALWAPPGHTPVEQVQDAFGGPGTSQDEGPNELAMLDVIGYTLAVAVPQTPPLVKIIRSGVNQFTLSWTNTATGYVLQERTNLVSGTWAFSTTGPTNPAVLLTSDSQKFYRLYKASAPSVMFNQSVAVQPSTHVYERVIHSIQPRKP